MRYSLEIMNYDTRMDAHCFFFFLPQNSFSIKECVIFREEQYIAWHTTLSNKSESMLYPQIIEGLFIEHCALDFLNYFDALKQFHCLQYNLNMVL